MGKTKEVKFSDFKPMAPNFTVVNGGKDATPISGVRFPAAGQNGQSSSLALTFTLVQREQRVEPLTMLVNPKDLKFTMSKVNSSEFSRRGWITEQWGDNLDSISCSGVSGGFYTQEYGLTRKFMHNSANYQYLMSLFLIFQNNGVEFTNAFNIQTFAAKNQVDPKALRSSIQENTPAQEPSISAEVASRTYPRPHTIGHILLTFDNYNFFGSFKDFSITEGAEDPFQLSYSFTFTIRGENPALFEGHYYTQDVKRGR